MCSKHILTRKQLTAALKVGKDSFKSIRHWPLLSSENVTKDFWIHTMLLVMDHVHTIHTYCLHRYDYMQGTSPTPPNGALMHTPLQHFSPKATETNNTKIVAKVNKQHEMWNKWYRIRRNQTNWRNKWYSYLDNNLLDPCSFGQH